ncbi:hypothetical protein ACHAWF_009971 [Thalassiosira exigua]
MGKPKRTDPSADPLRKTLESLQQIRSALLPYLRSLKNDDINLKRGHRPSPDSADTTRSKNKKKRSAHDDENDAQSTTSRTRVDPHKRAEAEAAVALAVGTLRYMGARLRGLDRGRKKGDPLRSELDKIRAMLVSLRKLEGGGANGSTEGTDSKVDESEKRIGDGGPKRKEGERTNGGIQSDEKSSPKKRQKKR